MKQTRKGSAMTPDSEHIPRPGQGPFRSVPAALLLCICIVWTTVPCHSAISEIDRVGGFLSPTRLTLTSNGEIYVSDHAKGTVAVLDSTGKRIRTIVGLGAPLGVHLYEPGAPPTEPTHGKRPKKKDPPPEIPPDVLYVGDESDGSVRLFIDGEPAGVLGQGAGEFQQPNAIETLVDALGTLRVYVVDSKANQVRVYDEQGALLFTFGAPGTALGEFQFPSDIAIDPVLEKVYVSDFLNERIAVFDLDGAPLGTIEAPNNDRGDPVFLRPAGLGIDPDGKLYVVDNGLSCVAILDNQGVLIDVIGYRDGQYWTDELVLPVDAASDGGRIYVTSNRQRQVVVFELLP